MRWDPLERVFLVYRAGGSPPKNTTTTTVNQLYSPEETARRAQVMDEAQKIYGQTSGNIQNLAPGGPSDATQKGQQMALDYANNAGSDMAKQLSGAVNFGLGDVLYPQSTPALQATIDTATRKIGQQYTDPGGVISNIRSNFTTGNTSGTGTRESIAGGLAARSYLDTVGDVTGKLTSDAYGQGLNFMGKAMSLAPTAMQAGMMPADTYSAVGQQQEGYAENQRQFEMNSPWMALGPYADVVMGMANPST
ncbi:MAG: hypothetical protein ACRD4I_14385, partial [Candidatus Angelobacter sp.]